MKSATHRWFGAGAVKFRSSRSGARAAFLSGIVVRTPRPRTRPFRPRWCISRSTRRADTSWPCRRRKAVIFRRPYMLSGIVAVASSASMMIASALSLVEASDLFQARYVRAATSNPCSRRTWQIDSTARCLVRCSSMNATINGVGGRVPRRRKPPRPSGSRSPHAAHGSPAPGDGSSPSRWS